MKYALSKYTSNVNYNKFIKFIISSGSYQVFGTCDFFRLKFQVVDLVLSTSTPLNWYISIFICFFKNENWLNYLLKKTLTAKRRLKFCDLLFNLKFLWQNWSITTGSSKYLINSLIWLHNLWLVWIISTVTKAVFKTRRPFQEMIRLRFVMKVIFILFPRDWYLLLVYTLGGGDKVWKFVWSKVM